MTQIASGADIRSQRQSRCAAESRAKAQSRKAAKGPFPLGVLPAWRDNQTAAESFETPSPRVTGNHSQSHACGSETTFCSGRRPKRLSVRNTLNRRQFAQRQLFLHDKLTVSSIDRIARCPSFKLGACGLLRIPAPQLHLQVSIRKWPPRRVQRDTCVLDHHYQSFRAVARLCWREVEAKYRRC